MTKQTDSNWTVLVADDDATARFLMERAFTKTKTQSRLQFVKDGSEAIDYLEARGIYQDRDRYPFPSLMTLDIKMPKVDGFGVLKWIKQHPTVKRLAVVVFSCSDEQTDIDRAYDMGANSYLVKSALYPEFTELV